MSTLLTRRRFIAIAVTLAAGAGIPFVISRKTNQPTHSAGPNQEGQPVTWKGVALGSDAELRLFDVERRQVEILINRVLAEVSRLERIFSLYRDDSLISHLNREGRLKNLPSDFLQLLSISRDTHRLTQGASDPSIQPLWNLYADHFRRNPKTETPPSERSTKDTLKLVDFNKVDFDTKEVRFTQRGMGLLLNGITQGYTTDKVAELLKQQGVSQALINMGEIYGFDNANQHEWNVSIRNPDQEDQILTTIAMKNQAFATSGGYGTIMDEAGKSIHLFNPRTDGGQSRYRGMSVMAESAAVADTFSTTFSIMDEAAIRVAAQVKNTQAWLVMPNNESKKIWSGKKNGFVSWFEYMNKGKSKLLGQWSMKKKGCPNRQPWNSCSWE